MANVMEISTPLGNDLLFHRMSAREDVSHLFEYQVDMLSKRSDISLDQIMGKNVTISLELPDDSRRHFNGFVTRFTQGSTQGSYFAYHATVRPWLWFLTRTADCRIFQKMTVPKILEKVLNEHSVVDLEFDLSGSYHEWEYCVQYRETDFNFVSRLMEQEGIYYFFKHQDKRHTMVIADAYKAHSAIANYAEVPFIPTGRTTRPKVEHVDNWIFEREIQPGKYVIDDYNFKTPKVELQTQTQIPRKHALADYEIYDYPGEYEIRGDGEQYVKRRLEEMHAQFELFHGRGNARGLAVGNLFKLTGHTRQDQNREYLILGASYNLEYSEYESLEGGGGSQFGCAITAMSSSEAFRPKRSTPKPIVQGPQTAMVVGPPGDEIHTDEFGRVKVHFHWDREGKQDENSSCFIRVSHPWAGKGWGAISVPRIGQEVIVDFLEGDPDRPIITGRVYNAETMPPFGMPAGAVVSGIKSSTHKGSGYNELSMDDTAGKEKITIHGQYDMNTTVEHDQTNTINNNRSTKVVVDDSLNVDANRTVHVKGKHSETVDSGQDVTVSSGYKETISGGATSSIVGGLTSTVDGKWDNTITGHLKEIVSAGEEQEVTGGKKLTVTGGLTEAITGEHKTTVTGPIDQSATATISAHATGAGTYTSDASLTMAVAGSMVEITPAAITISSSGSTIKIDASGVSINGAKISLN